MIICDTSGLLACLDSRQSRHAEAVRAALSDRGPLVLSPFVLAELDYLIAREVGHAAATRFLVEVAGGVYLLETIDASDIAACLAIAREYADLQIGLADASLVVLAERHRTNRLLTLDQRHFRAVRPLQGGAFRLLPLDA